jgi:hypothetical protein
MFTMEQVTAEPPSTFGALGAWHFHEDLCFTLSGVSVKSDAAQCPGVFVERTPWMLHVWTVPGATGVFAHDFAPISPGAFPPAARSAATELGLRRQ